MPYKLNYFHTLQPVCSSLEELFQLVKDMCLHKLAPDIYAKLRDEMDLHVRSTRERLITEQDGVPSEEFLLLMDRCWLDHCRNVVCSSYIYDWYTVHTHSSPTHRHIRRS